MTLRHQWYVTAVRLAACADGNDRTIRRCMRCGLAKVTVHPPHGFPWLEWEPADGEPLKQEHTPPCVMDGTTRTEGAA